MMRKTRAAVVALAAMSVALLAGCGEDEQPADAPEKSVSSSGEAAAPSAVPEVRKKKQRTVAVSTSSILNFSDPANVAEWSDAVFRGTVTEKVGPVSWGGSDLPMTLYRVNVVEALSGELPSEILVSQDGGYSKQDDVVYLFNDDNMLKVGNEYVLAGRFGGPQDSLTVISYYGTLAVDAPEAADTVEAAEAVEASAQ